MEIEMLTNCVLNAINCEGEIEMNYLRNEEEPNSLYFQCICDQWYIGNSHNILFTSQYR